MSTAEKDVFGAKKFVNNKGNTECVEFVRQVSSAPHTSLWRRGIKVKDASDSAIRRGAVIATFDDQEKYPTDNRGKHAAIYLGKNTNGIKVLDQWDAQGEVLARTIQFSHPGRRSDNGDTYYVVE